MLFRSLLNSFLNFDDFWGTIGYERLFTVYSSLVPTDFWRPRKAYPDNEIELPRELVYRNDIGAEMAIVRGISAPQSDAQWSALGNDLRAVIPEPVRRHMVVAICENSPFYLDRATERERESRRNMRARTLAIITEVGAEAVSACDGFDKDDYIDRVHLSVRGARNIAGPLAQAVRRLVAGSGMK